MVSFLLGPDLFSDAFAVSFREGCITLQIANKKRPSSRRCCLKRSWPGIEGYHRTSGASAMGLGMWGWPSMGYVMLCFSFVFRGGGCVVCIMFLLDHVKHWYLIHVYVYVYIYVFMYVCYFCIWVHDPWRTENIGVGFNICMSCIYILCICICIQCLCEYIFMFVFVYRSIIIYIYVLVMFRCIHYYTFSFEKWYI